MPISKMICILVLKKKYDAYVYNMCSQLLILRDLTVAVKLLCSNFIYGDRGCTPNIISQIFGKVRSRDFIVVDIQCTLHRACHQNEIPHNSIWFYKTSEASLKEKVYAQKKNKSMSEASRDPGLGFLDFMVPWTGFLLDGTTSALSCEQRSQMEFLDCRPTEF